jgi:glutathione S-transferase
MAIKLHRCRNLWVKVGGHPCWRVQKALDEQGIEYEVVPGPVRRSRRDHMQEHTGQRLYPAIEFEDGTWYREESKRMEEEIRAGRLMEKRLGSNPPAAG